MRRVRLTFWLLVVTAVISTSALMSALDWSTGITVAASGVVTAVAVALATRIMVVISRGR